MFKKLRKKCIHFQNSDCFKVDMIKFCRNCRYNKALEDAEELTAQKISQLKDEITVEYMAKGEFSLKFIIKKFSAILGEVEK